MYTLPTLPYAFDALEPFIDARTMEIHYAKHHQGYANKISAALEGTEWIKKPIEEVITYVQKMPEPQQRAVRQSGGGHANHTLFWSIMGPKNADRPSGKLADAITKIFGTFEKFQEKFSAEAATQFGSGWAWLVAEDGKLEVGSTSNQDSPLMGKEIAGIGGTPILCLDVWEHAYYLHYQNRRPEYITAWWNVVNWKEVERRFEETF